MYSYGCTQEVRRVLRVVKSSQLLAKIATCLVCIGQLLYLAFVYGWCFLNKISLDWPLTLTTQSSTSKPFDNRGLKKGTTPFRVVPPGFENRSCITRKFDKRRKGITSTIS